jgi:peptidoglycan-associated lipoprotein
MRMNMLVSSVSLIVLAGSVSACHHRSPVVSPSLTHTAPAAPLRLTPVAHRVASAAAPRRLTPEEIFERTSLEELNNDHPLSDAFFDYDSSVIRPDGQESLSKDADWLKQWPSTKITVSGHCDERGTAEYNLALGERRADAVKSYLVSLGVPADRIETISYGKERPFCTGDTDACWSENRRGHFLITAK